MVLVFLNDYLKKLVISIVRSFHTGTTNQLGYCLAGFIEGYGSIILRKDEKEKIYPNIILLLVKMRFLYMKNYRRF